MELSERLVKVEVERNELRAALDEVRKHGAAAAAGGGGEAASPTGAGDDALAAMFSSQFGGDAGKVRERWQRLLWGPSRCPGSPPQSLCPAAVTNGLFFASNITELPPLEPFFLPLGPQGSLDLLGSMDLPPPPARVLGGSLGARRSSVGGRRVSSVGGGGGADGVGAWGEHNDLQRKLRAADGKADQLGRQMEQLR